MAGYKVVQIPSRSDGCVDLDALRAAASERTAAFMITNPSTLGTFEEDILDIAKIIHEVGAILYYDGANLNAIMGWCRPGDMGFDIMHFNLHKTFATPHGGGGPGGGPIGVTKELAKYLPVPMVARRESKDAQDGWEYHLDYNRPDSIGKVKGFHGNFGVNLKAWTYIRLMGGNGLKELSEQATLNCNYLKHKLLPHYPMPFKELRKHEFVLSGDNMKPYGLSTRDIAKRLMDYGFHAPTIYFPLVVSEALMIEPTENEPKETLDDFAEAMIAIAGEAKTAPELVSGAPRTTGTSRADEVWSGKNLILTWRIARQKGLEE
jgi:glycine dehydrogenase subunit 2